ncbi:CDC20-like protein [Mya arenaria]|uniref:CDC20-like protein n=1 Tax=Mya arenaria TaxID=6604 RepID=A0ABY7FN05_MYAAR|nr:CDC20-like protein [Mya arenaria]
MIAVALHQSTYVWNAESKECQRIEIYVPDVTSGYYISALSWDTKDGNLAIAENKGRINVCDVEKMATSRQFDAWSEKCPVGVIRWTDYGLISGNRKGAITLHDMRTKHPHMVCLTNGSAREVCGLALSHGTSCLASGGDDGVALAWCPWRQGVLATGGGTSDGHIRLWYAQSGDKLGEAFTRSQVCGLVWSEEYKELVSALGSATPDKNDLILWNMKNSEFDPVARLRHHMARPLHVALSPDHTTIATAGADESLCLWNTFPKRCSQRLWSPWDRSPLNPSSYIR